MTNVYTIILPFDKLNHQQSNNKMTTLRCFDI